MDATDENQVVRERDRLERDSMRHCERQNQVVRERDGSQLYTAAIPRTLNARSATALLNQPNLMRSDASRLIPGSVASLWYVRYNTATRCAAPSSPNKCAVPGIALPDTFRSTIGSSSSGKASESSLRTPVSCVSVQFQPMAMMSVPASLNKSPERY